MRGLSSHLVSLEEGPEPCGGERGRTEEGPESRTVWGPESESRDGTRRVGTGRPWTSRSCPVGQKSSGDLSSGCSAFPLHPPSRPHCYFRVPPLSRSLRSSRTTPSVSRRVYFSRGRWRTHPEKRDLLILRKIEAP